MIRTLLSGILTLVITGQLFATEGNIDWLEGPAVAKMGNNLAEITIDSSYIFADGNDARRLMSMIGNPPSNLEVGLISPINNALAWFVLFEYKNVGYIKDDDKNKIDEKKILKNIKQGTDASNAERVKMGGRPLEVIGWYEKPHYDESTNNLVWAILAVSGNDTIVNYNTRLLGRSGYTSVVVVASMEQLNQIKPEIEKLLSTFTYTKGKKYSEFVKGDKIAEYGLAALVAGGAGAAAVKFGLFKVLAKAWKLVVIGIAAFALSLKKLFPKLLGMEKKEKRDLPK